MVEIGEGEGDSLRVVQLCVLATERDASEVEWFLLKLHFTVGISVLQ